jgi:hypothetical protein
MDKLSNHSGDMHCNWDTLGGIEKSHDSEGKVVEIEERKIEMENQKKCIVQDLLYLSRGIIQKSSGVRNSFFSIRI